MRKKDFPLIIKTLIENGYNMEKMELSFNSVGSLQIKDYSHKQFYNGLAIVRIINHYKKYIKIDVMRPDYLASHTLTLYYREDEKKKWR